MGRPVIPRCSSSPAPPPPPSCTLAPEGAGVPPGGRAGGKGGAPLSTHSCLHPLFCPRAPAGPPAPCQGEPRPSWLTRQELLELVTSRLSPRGTLSFLVNKFLQRLCSRPRWEALLSQGAPRGLRLRIEPWEDPQGKRGLQHPPHPRGPHFLAAPPGSWIPTSFLQRLFLASHVTWVGLKNPTSDPDL